MSDGKDLGREVAERLVSTVHDPGDGSLLSPFVVRIGRVDVGRYFDEGVALCVTDAVRKAIADAVSDALSGLQQDRDGYRGALKQIAAAADLPLTRRGCEAIRQLANKALEGTDDATA